MPKEIKDDELENVNGGFFLFDLLFGKKTQTSNPGTTAATRTQENSCCDKFERHIDKPAYRCCGNCIHFTKIGDSGTCDVADGQGNTITNI